MQVRLKPNKPNNLKGLLNNNNSKSKEKISRKTYLKDIKENQLISKKKREKWIQLDKKRWYDNIVVLLR